MKKIRQISLKIHSYLSLIFLIPIFLSCLSGAILVYKDEINALLNPSEVFRSDQGSERLSFDKLREIALRANPNFELISWKLSPNLSKNDELWFLPKGLEKEWYRVYLNAYTGEIKSSPTAHHSGFLGFLTELHENLFLEKTGSVVLGLGAISLLLISLSGFFIHANFFKNLFRLRFARLLVFASDIHKLIGAIATPILLIIALSGLYYQVKVFISPFNGYESFVVTDKIYNKNISVDSLVLKSKQDLAGFSPRLVVFPFFQGANILIFGEVKGQNPLFSEYSSSFIFDKDSAKLLAISDIAKASFSQKLMASARKAHLGYYNQASKFIWFLVGLSPVILLISGFYLWIKRANFKRRKNEKEHKPSFAFGSSAKR